MANIRFWKWQYTDEIGAPRATRYPLSGANSRQRLGDSANGEWSPELRDPKQLSPNELQQGAPK
jgi:hypothetical protein